MRFIEHLAPERADAADGWHFGLPFSDNGRHYYCAVSERPVADWSFGFVDDDGPCVLVGCNDFDPDCLTCFGSPIELWVDRRVPRSAWLRLARDILGRLKKVAGDAGMARIRIRTRSDEPFSEVLCARLLGVRARPAPAFTVRFDLAEDDATLLAGMRSGHRQQVRWGERNMETLAVGQDNPDRALFDEFRQLHREVAGRTTRPQASWQAMFDLVSSGRGDLILSRIDGQLMGGTLVLDAGGVCHYASGAYRREHFDKPLTHYPLWRAVQRARIRGNRLFHVGEASVGSDTDDKARSIAGFKLGFSSTIATSLVWDWELG